MRNLYYRYVIVNKNKYDYSHWEICNLYTSF